MTLSRRSRLKSNPDHGPPVEVPTMGVPACPRCHRPYRWSSETGRRTKPPFGPCSGLKSSGGSLQRSGGGLKRSRLRRVSPTNSDHPKDDPAYRRWIRELPCVVCGSPPPNDPHHVRSKGSGHGDWIETPEGKVGNLVPLDRKCHDAYHRQGRDTFADEHGISLADEARRLGERWRGRE